MAEGLRSLRGGEITSPGGHERFDYVEDLLGSACNAIADADLNSLRLFLEGITENSARHSEDPSSTPITGEQRDQLWSALAKCEKLAGTIFPDWAPRSIIHDGIHATMVQVMRWSRSSSARSEEPDFVQQEVDLSAGALTSLAAAIEKSADARDRRLETAGALEWRSRVGHGT